MNKTLLKTKICDLDLSLNRFIHKDLVAQLYQELKRNNITFRPHIWISDDWFSPTGVTGFAIPFYLFDDEIKEIEREYIGRVEGECPLEFMRLLRHECGHAIDHAYFFKDDRNWKNIFGNYEKAYPKSYTYKKYSKSFVRNLEEGYAQSHPDEDWAETFAVWLDSRNSWRAKYKNWSCLKKLNYMNRLMKNVGHRKENIILNKSIDHYSEMDMTIEEYLIAKRRRLKKKNLGRVSISHLHPSLGKDEEGEDVIKLIKKYNYQLKTKVALNLGLKQYQLHEAISNLKKVSKAQSLKINKKVTSKREQIRILEECYYSHTFKYFNSQSHRVIM